ncbi:MAG: GNAT family N-acetyltransferase [Clostridium sp.]|nr:GNAT family N-acetyltransferase [Clostridium sp.]
MIFEKAVYEDIEQLSELRIAYLIEDTGNLNEKDLEIIKRDLPEYFKRHLNKNIFCYAARKEKEIAACAFLLVVEKPMSPAFITGKTGTVLNVYTKPESRHHGYARKLMNIMLSDAVSMNLSSIELKATDIGYSLYKSLNFKDEITKYHLMKWTNEDL